MNTAVLVPLLETEALVASHRARFDPSADKGIPAHVTLLYPFVPSERIDDELRTLLGGLFAEQAAFDVTFRQLRRFPGVLYLAPEPVEPFVSLIDALVDRFPEHPPYGGVFDEVIPHLTVADGPDDVVLDEIATAVARDLPLTTVVTAAWLMVEGSDGRWSTDARFPFAET